MRGALFQRAPGAMHQLTEGLRTPPRTADQLSPAQSGMATYRPRSLIRVNSRIFAAHSLGLRHAKRPPRPRLRSNGEGFTNVKLQPSVHHATTEVRFRKITPLASAPEFSRAGSRAICAQCVQCTAL